MCSAWMTHARSHASFTNWRCIELTVQQGNPYHTEYSLRIIYNLQFEESNFWFDIYSFISLLSFNKNNTWRPTCFIIQTTGFNRPAKFLILLKHWGYENFELNWFHGLLKSLAIPFSQVSTNSFRFNIQKCSRSLYAFIAFRPTCFTRRLVMRNLHETST